MNKSEQILFMFKESNEFSSLFYKNVTSSSTDKEVALSDELNSFMDSQGISINIDKNSFQGLDKINVSKVLISLLYSKDIKKEITGDQYYQSLDSYLTPIVKNFWVEILDTCLNVLTMWETKVKMSSKESNYTPLIKRLILEKKQADQNKIDMQLSNFDSNEVHSFSSVDKNKFLKLTLEDILNSRVKFLGHYNAVKIGNYLVYVNNQGSIKPTISIVIPNYFKNGDPKQVVGLTSKSYDLKPTILSKIKKLFLDNLIGKPINYIYDIENERSYARNGA